MYERWKPLVKRLLGKHPRLYALARAASRRLRGTAAPPGLAGGGHWDQMVAEIETGRYKGWLDWQYIEEEYIRPQVSGDRNVYYLQHFFDRHVPRRPVARALSLGCGGGNLERALIGMATAEHIDAFDASPESIRMARELAADAGLDDRIRYQVADIDRIELEPGVYDFVVAKMALHHFERLEHVYAEVRKALKPDGVFMFNEFVGPSRFQWTDLQLELMNRLLELLPRSNRERIPLARIERPSLAEMLAVDPTESVRSAEILPLLERDFEIVEKKPYGGTLLHILLTHAMGTFDLGDDDQRSLLGMLFLFERTLIEHGVLASDFVYVVARPRPSAGET